MGTESHVSWCSHIPRTCWTGMWGGETQESMFAPTHLKFHFWYTGRSNCTRHKTGARKDIHSYQRPQSQKPINAEWKQRIIRSGSPSHSLPGNLYPWELNQVILGASPSLLVGPNYPKLKLTQFLLKDRVALGNLSHCGIYQFFRKLFLIFDSNVF